MYDEYLHQLENEGKLRNLKERSIVTYKNYIIYFLNYTGRRKIAKIRSFFSLLFTIFCD